MKANQEMNYYHKLNIVATEVVELLSETIDVNTIFLASNDEVSNFIIKAFNRQSLLLKEGDRQPFKDVLCRLVLENESEPLVIPNLKENPLSYDHPITQKIGNGCFLGVPIYKGNGEVYGTLCAFDTKPYEFRGYDIKLIKTLGALISQTIYLEDGMIRDSLTGLYNRHFLKGYFQYYIKEATDLLSVLYIDVDHFKEINDNYGHDIGDEVLKNISTMLKEMAPEKSIISRIGGDEFILLVPESSKKQQEAKALGERILTTLASQPIMVEAHHHLSVSASIGVSLYPRDGDGLDTLLKEADQAMYNVKRKGRNNIHFYK